MYSITKQDVKTPYPWTAGRDWQNIASGNVLNIIHKYVE